MANKNKRKSTVVSLPNWKWWQTTLFVVTVIMTFRVDGDKILELLKNLVKVFSG